MSTAFEDQVREVLCDAPEPDWRAFRAAVDDRARHQRRDRMLRASLGGIAAAAAVVAIAVSAASTPMFDGSGVTPARSSTPSTSGSPSSDIPDSTAFEPRVKLANGDYRLPTAFPDVAPQGAAAPQGLVRDAAGTDPAPFAAVASAACLSNEEAADPQPWGSQSWVYRPRGQPKALPGAEVTVAGWPTSTAIPAMGQLADNSGPCAYDTHFRKVAWPGRAATEANQFVVDAPSTTGERRFVAIRRVGDVTVDAWTSGSDEAAALTASRRLVDESVAALLASKVLDQPRPHVFEWSGGSYEGAPDVSRFILPAIAPEPAVTGVANLVPMDWDPSTDMDVVPVYGAQVGFDSSSVMEPVAVRTANYELKGVPREDEGLATSSMVWSSFPEGQRAFDEIVANRGTARWSRQPVRETWAGHDPATTYLAAQSGQVRPQQIALRLEGNVLISVVSQGRTQAEARTIATTLADEAAKNLAAFGRGPDGRPGNGR